VQYGLTAKGKIEKLFEPHDRHKSGEDDCSFASDLDNDEKDDEPFVAWLKNAYRGVPTDEDLRKAYHWEGRRLGAKTRESYATLKRLARLKGLWKAQWYASVKIRVGKNKRSEEAWFWEEIFAVVQGRRFLWWKEVEDFDSGQPPLGRIFLAGHAGLCSLSPLEMREISKTDVPFCVGIFGRGLEVRHQQRIILLLPSLEIRVALENSVISAEKED